MSPQASGWSQIEVAGHECDVYEPERVSEHGYVVVYLHGVHLGRLVDKLVYQRLFDQYGLRVIAPMTRRSWWTDRICPEFDPTLTAERHLLENVVPYVQTRWQVNAPRLALLGTSMGGQGALRVAFKHPDTFPVVAAVAPAIDYQQRFDEDDSLQQMYDDPEAVRQDTATLHVHPLNWPRNIWFCCDPRDDRWWDGADRLRMKLFSLGIPHDCDLETTSTGHGWPYYSSMAEAAVGFIFERLEQERLRVV